MIPRQIVEQVSETATANIVSVVGDYVSLKRKGVSYMGCCPFHNEKTPSFSVNPVKGFYYCFGCHKGGNAVNFVIEMEKLTFPDAIRLLGKRFGISVPEEELNPEEQREGRERDALFAAMEYATRTYEANLRETEEGQAYGLTYFRHRGFRDDTIATFRLGYSINDYNGLKGKALTEGYKEEVLVKAGLIKAGEKGGTYDYFRGRVMFPIQNVSGKVIGFGGRVLDARTKGVTLKYLNTPETDLYKKTDIVYGIYQARTEISRKDKCYLVEGYTDVISMHQNGIANVVASSGTALTSSQIHLIKRFTNNITVLYDGDSAGIHASLRGINMILHEGMNARVLLLPDGDDPDSFSQKHSAEDFQKYVEEHETDFIRYEAETLLAGTENEPLKRAEATHLILVSVAEVQDAIKREFYVKECARLMGLSEETVFTELQRIIVQNAADQRDAAVREQRQRQYQEQRQAEMAYAAQQNQTMPMQPAAQVQQPAQYAQPADLPPDLPPDLSPSELAMIQGSAGAPAAMQTPRPAAPPTPKPEVPQEVEMHEIMRFFVTYTQTKMNTTSAQTTVAEYILNALDADGLHPQTPVLQRILEEYRSASDRTKLDINYFRNMPDPEISTFVAQAIMSRPELSKMHSRVGTVELEKDQLDDFVPRAVKELQMKLVIKMGDDARRQLNELIAQNAPDEQLDEIMVTIQNLDMVKRELAMEMGERAIVK